MQARSFLVRLEQVYSLAKGVKHFVLKKEGGDPFHYLAGQFITVHFEYQGQTYKRSYSIANPPGEEGRIEFSASFVEHGPGSLFLFGLEPGATLNISGPYGRLILKEAIPSRYIFVGTGTGAAPYRSMVPALQRLLEKDPNLQIVLLEGVRTRADLLYADEFRAWVKASSRVQFIACLSRHQEGDLQQDERLGYVQNLFSELSLRPEQDLVYLCGNPGMIDDAFAKLLAAGFTTQHVVREKYISNK